MKTFALISLAVCLLSLTSCSTAKPDIVVKTEYVKTKVPAALIVPCEKKQRGPLATTQAIVQRLQYTEGALDRCAAKIAGVTKWNVGQ